MTVSRNTLGYWGQRSPHSLLYYLPNQISDEFCDRHQPRDIDVLVGTQMIAKGHDFRRITLVASVNADSALFASDHRAPERLFALLE